MIGGSLLVIDDADASRCARRKRGNILFIHNSPCKRQSARDKVQKNQPMRSRGSDSGVAKVRVIPLPAFG